MLPSHLRRTITSSRRSLHFLATSPTSMRWFSSESPEREMPPREMHSREMPEREMHSREMPPMEMHSREMPWREMHSREMPPREMPPTRDEVSGGGMSLSEAKKLMRLVNVEALKEKLAEEGKEVICYGELLKCCESFGVARSIDEAKAFARVLDDAGVVLLFRDKVYLHPDKVVELVRRSVPLALTPEDDPRREELKKLEERKEEIDKQAEKEVRVILWVGLGLTVSLVGLFFRLTFWEFSWDVMEPITFFTTTTGLVVGYAYFMFTAKDPTYQDLMQTIFLSRQRKLMKRHNFDVDTFQELRLRCKTPPHRKHSN